MDITLLHLACSEGHVEIAQFLIDNGAHINSRQKGEYGYDNTPLFITARNGYSKRPPAKQVAFSKSKDTSLYEYNWNSTKLNM
jgi:hypothetical protein